MKKVFKIVGLVLLLLLVFVFLSPFLFKGKILKLAKSEISNYVDAKVDFSDLDLTIFKSFPAFTISLSDICVQGIGRFEGDTLAQIKNIYIDVDFMSVIKGDEIGVSRIVLNTPYFNGIMLADSTANWNIAKADTSSTPSDTVSKPLEYKISLKHFEIIDAQVNYSDYTSGTFMKVSNFDMMLTGDFSEKKTMLDNSISIEDLFLQMGNITYLNHANFAFDAKIDADMENSKFSFLDNSLKVNAMELLFQGWVLLKGNDIDMDVSFGLKNTEFKELLSLIPGAYKSDFENIKTEGVLSFEGKANGRYSDSLEMYPAFNLLLKVANASVKYPELPGKISNIQLDLNIDNADGVLDNTVIDLKQLHLEFDKNPFDIKLLVKTPLSDPYLNCKLIGNLELSEMKKFIPLDSTELQGQINSNIAVECFVSQIEKEEFDKVKAEGDLTITNFKYIDADFPQGILISNAGFQFSPQYLNILQLNSIIGKSNFSITGRVENFIPYVLANQTIVGDITFNSTYLDLDELMGAEPEDTTNSTVTTIEDSSNTEPLQIPNNINFNLNTNISTIIYDGIKITNESGLISVNNAIAEIKNLKLKVLDGNIKLQGLLNTQNPYKPLIDINLDVDRLSIEETYNTFDIIKEMVPFAKYCKGIFGLNIDFSSLLDTELSPILKTINGKGNVITKNIILTDSKIQAVLVDKLKQEKYKTIDLKDLKITFEIIDGTIKTNPFDFNFSGNTSSVSGSSSLDQTINYVMDIAIPKSNLGNANEFIDGLMSQLPTIGGAKPTLGDKLFFDIIMKGNILNPNISFIPKTSANGSSVTDQLKNELNKKKEEVKQEIDKAKQEAVKQIEQTKQTVTNEVKKEVQETKTEVKKEVKKETQKNLNKLLKK